MASYLETALSEIVARIDPSALVPHGCGRQKLEAREALPRVIWTRGDGSAKFIQPMPSANPKRVLCMENTPVAVHIIAEDSDKAEDLVDIEVRALFQLFGQHAIANAQTVVDESAETLKAYGYYTQLRVFVPRPVYIDAPAKFKASAYEINPNTSIQDGWITVKV